MAVYFGFFPVYPGAIYRLRIGDNHVRYKMEHKIYEYAESDFDESTKQTVLVCSCGEAFLTIDEAYQHENFFRSLEEITKQIIQDLLK